MIDIRRPAPSDAADLAAMVEELHRHQGDQTGYFTPEVALADVIADDAPVSAVIARDAAGALGFAFWHFSYETSWAARGSYLSDLYVREGARRSGLGDRLLRKVAEATHRAGGTFIWWTAYNTNVNARGFYRARAYEQDGVVAYAAAHGQFKALLREGGGGSD